MRKHVLWFPYLIIALTAVLAVTIVLVDKNRSEVEANVDYVDNLKVTEPVSGIDINESRAYIADALDPIWAMIEVGDGDIDVVKDVRDQILAARVVREDKDTHILIVVALNKLVAGLGGDEAVLAEAQIKFSELSDSIVWIRKRN